MSLFNSVIYDLGQKLSPKVFDQFQLRVLLPEANGSVNDFNFDDKSDSDGPVIN